MSDEISAAFLDGAFADEEVPTSTTSPTTSYKIKIIGEQGVGKSALLVRSTKSNWKEDKHSQRIHPDTDTKTTTVTSRDERFQVVLSDSKPSDKSIRGGGITDADGIILVYDATRPDTFDKIAVWARQLRYNPNAVVCLVGNKVDLKSEKAVDTVTAHNLAVSKGWLFSEVSAKESESLDDCLQSLVSKIQDRKKDAERPRKSKKSKCTLQ